MREEKSCCTAPSHAGADLARQRSTSSDPLAHAAKVLKQTSAAANDKGEPDLLLTPLEVQNQ